MASIPHDLTVTTLDVSQNARSSPMNYSGTVPVQHTIEVVEDSLKDVPEVYRGGAVRTPQPLPPDDYENEDLYSVTPEAKNAPKERPAAKKSIEPAHDGQSDAGGAGREETPAKARNTQQVRPATTANLINGLLDEGATTLRTDRPRKSQASQQQVGLVQNG